MRLLPIFLLVVPFLSSVFCTGSNDPVRPNILWIIAEDLSQDLECYGNDGVSTPRINYLADEGVRFTNFFTAAAVCAPSRTALALGMYQTSVDAHHMRYPDELRNSLPEDVIPLNELFRRGGYVTAHIQDKPASTKLDWSFAKSDLTGFDVKHWEDLKKSEKPFFALANLKMTHRYFVKDNENPVDSKDVTVPSYYPDVSVVRRDLADYCETIQHLDRQVGQVLDQLQANGLAENTIVFFLSDHGRPFPRAKNSLYDSGTRVPFIAYFPKNVAKPKHFKAGQVDDRLLSSIDLCATSLALAGIDVPELMEGQAFYAGEPHFERSFVISCLDRIGGTNFKSRTIRTKTYRLIWNINHDFSTNEGSTAYRKAMHPIYHVLNLLNERGELDSAQKTIVDQLPEYELFEVSKDPEEVNNLAKDPKYRNVKSELVNLLEKWIEESGDKGMIEDSAEIIKAFSDYRSKSHALRGQKIQELRDEVVRELRANGEL